MNALFVEHLANKSRRGLRIRGQRFDAREAGSTLVGGQCRIRQSGHLISTGTPTVIRADCQWDDR
jgi:hypothetical protein